MFLSIFKANQCKKTMQKPVHDFGFKFKKIKILLKRMQNSSNISFVIIEETLLSRKCIRLVLYYV